MLKQLWATKHPHAAHEEANGLSLRRTLGPWGLTALGIGAVIGGGIFVITGQAAAIGRNGTLNNQYFAGDVDDLAIWRRALDPAEVRQIYEAGTNGIPLERSVMTLWIANVYPDLETGDMQMDLRVEHGSLTNQTLRLRGAALATGTYADQTVLAGGKGRRPHFRVPNSDIAYGHGPMGRREADRPNFFQVICP